MERDVLLAVNRESRWRGQDAGRNGELPKQLSIRGIEGVNLAIGGAAREHEAAGGGEHGAPVRALRIVVRPYFLSRIDVPCLDLAEMVRTGRINEVARTAAASGSSKAAAGGVCNFVSPCERAA